MSGVDIAGLVERVGAYLSNGGLFNPELADHAAVRDLVVECRDALLAQAAELAEARAYREELLKIAADVGEPDDPFASWEVVQALTRQRDEALAALKASEEALKPFAKVAERYDGVEHIRRQPALEAHLFDLTIEHFRRARSVLENGSAPLADATNNPPSDPGTEQREAGDADLP